jgi:hypothetical protein
MYVLPSHVPSVQHLCWPCSNAKAPHAFPLRCNVARKVGVTHALPLDPYIFPSALGLGLACPLFDAVVNIDQIIKAVAIRAPTQLHIRPQ